ncbi:hypothetical protein IWQ62_002467 [Dispira parvispora]|uniref:PH domain-containing protein n=1 Tax=Dispira parvispora TaxID=1520584 RepID=A0A9W8APY4_9FUNG|nr:hypothetical protein IWQ62_002467 [Dispira parvispora]
MIPPTGGVTTTTIGHSVERRKKPSKLLLRRRLTHGRNKPNDSVYYTEFVIRPDFETAHSFTFPLERNIVVRSIPSNKKSLDSDDSGAETPGEPLITEELFQDWLHRQDNVVQEHPKGNERLYQYDDENRTWHQRHIHLEKCLLSCHQGEHQGWMTILSKNHAESPTSAKTKVNRARSPASDDSDTPSEKVFHSPTVQKPALLPRGITALNSPLSPPLSPLPELLHGPKRSTQDAICVPLVTDSAEETSPNALTPESATQADSPEWLVHLSMIKRIVMEHQPTDQLKFRVLYSVKIYTTDNRVFHLAMPNRAHILQWVSILVTQWSQFFRQRLNHGNLGNTPASAGPVGPRHPTISQRQHLLEQLPILSAPSDRTNCWTKDFESDEPVGRHHKSSGSRWLQHIVDNILSDPAVRVAKFGPPSPTSLSSDSIEATIRELVQEPIVPGTRTAPGLSGSGRISPASDIPNFTVTDGGINIANTCTVDDIVDIYENLGLPSPSIVGDDGEASGSDSCSVPPTSIPPIASETCSPHRQDYNRSKPQYHAGDSPNYRALLQSVEYVELEESLDQCHTTESSRKPACESRESDIRGFGTAPESVPLKESVSTSEDLLAIPELALNLPSPLDTSFLEQKTETWAFSTGRGGNTLRLKTKRKFSLPEPSPALFHHFAKGWRPWDYESVMDQLHRPGRSSDQESAISDLLESNIAEESHTATPCKHYSGDSDELPLAALCPKGPDLPKESPAFDPRFLNWHQEAVQQAQHAAAVIPSCENPTNQKDVTSLQDYYIQNIPDFKALYDKKVDRTVRVSPQDMPNDKPPAIGALLQVQVEKPSVLGSTGDLGQPPPTSLLGRSEVVPTNVARQREREAAQQRTSLLADSSICPQRNNNPSHLVAWIPSRDSKSGSLGPTLIPGAAGLSRPGYDHGPRTHRRTGNQAARMKRPAAANLTVRIPPASTRLPHGNRQRDTTTVTANTNRSPKVWPSPQSHTAGLYRRGAYTATRARPARTPRSSKPLSTSRTIHHPDGSRLPTGVVPGGQFTPRGTSERRYEPLLEAPPVPPPTSKPARFRTQKFQDAGVTRC